LIHRKKTSLLLWGYSTTARRWKTSGYWQRHDTEPYISRSSTTTREELSHLRDLFLPEKADFNKLKILILTITSYS